jgi:hypothetical protein
LKKKNSYFFLLFIYFFLYFIRLPSSFFSWCSSWEKLESTECSLNFQEEIYFADISDSLTSALRKEKRVYFIFIWVVSCELNGKFNEVSYLIKINIFCNLFFKLKWWKFWLNTSFDWWIIWIVYMHMLKKYAFIRICKRLHYSLLSYHQVIQLLFMASCWLHFSNEQSFLLYIFFCFI